MEARWVFDEENYERLNAARAAILSEILRDLRGRLELQTAIDVGCGVGFFTNLLAMHQMEVLGLDGRRENISEALRRYPCRKFLCFDAEDPALADLGTMDLVLCFGLLYHLENPLLVVRQLQRMTARLLLIESVIFPGEEPLMALVDEASSEDQGLRHVGFYPTEACLVKMLYRAGFPHVSRATRLPDHPEYHRAPGWRRNRTILAASRADLHSALFSLAPEPATTTFPWDPASGVQGSLVLNKLRRFLQRPLPMKWKSLKRLVHG